jgi:hypothetical protein
MQLEKHDAPQQAAVVEVRKDTAIGEQRPLPQPVEGGEWEKKVAKRSEPAEQSIEKGQKASAPNAKKRKTKVLVKNRQRPVEKTKSVVVQEKVVKEKGVALSFDQLPVTRAQAQEWAMKHYAEGRKLLVSNPDSAMKHIERGLDLYENGSLFVAKAEALLRAGQATGAVNAIDVALTRKDYWRKEDYRRGLGVKVKALEEIARKYPSTRVEKQLEEARHAFELAQ